MRNKAGTLADNSQSKQTRVKIDKYIRSLSFEINFHITPEVIDFTSHNSHNCFSSDVNDKGRILWKYE